MLQILRGAWYTTMNCLHSVKHPLVKCIITVGLCTLLLLTCALVGDQSEVESRPIDEQTAPENAVLKRGAKLFANQCAICHGDRGDGQGKFAYLMNPRPRDFHAGKFKISTTANMIPSDGDLFRTISRGMPGSAMPPWGHLPESDIDALVQYVRDIHIRAVSDKLKRGVIAGDFEEQEIEEELAKQTKPGNPLYVPPEPAFDSVRWFRGRRIYLAACAGCHGATGDPVPEAVKFDEEGFPVPPRSFVSGIFKGGSEGHELYARIKKGMRGTPMPGYEDIYNSDEMWDLIHYVQSLARVGAQDRAQLKQETIVAPAMSGPLPDDPLAPEWDKARPVFVGLTPLWWTEDRIEGLVVQALHNGDELAIRMSWQDPTEDDRAVRHEEFRDAIGIQFSQASDPPFYMGDPTGKGGVSIWLWKADRQKDLAKSYQDVDATFPDRAVDTYQEQSFTKEQLVGFKEWPRSRITDHDPLFISAWGASNLVANPAMESSVESLVARGPGTLSARPAGMQLVQGKAAYQSGVWHVQMQRSMNAFMTEDAKDDLVFKAGDYLPLSFAIWNGSAGDRDGKKNISIWQKLVIQ